MALCARWLLLHLFCVTLYMLSCFGDNQIRSLFYLFPTLVMLLFQRLCWDRAGHLDAYCRGVRSQVSVQLGGKLSRGKCGQWFIYWSNTLRLRQNGSRFADDIFKGVLFNENVWISIMISLKFIPKGIFNDITALVQIMPLPEAMIARVPTHICVSLNELKLIKAEFLRRNIAA